mmetsp:Transcript_8242/g.18435  ORF Transcript_8242/g.18435 Transcript_8242/m.18435 type:complete len:399 (+) Transcript_8242:68-1264(+)
MFRDRHFEDSSASSSAIAVARTNNDDPRQRGGKWELELLEEKMSRQVNRAQEQMERFLQVVVQPLEAKVAACESKQNSVVLRLAELTGNIKGLKEEVEVQARRADAVEGRLQRWKKSFDAELQSKHEEFRQQILCDWSREIELLRSELLEKVHKLLLEQQEQQQQLHLPQPEPEQMHGILAELSGRHRPEELSQLAPTVEHTEEISVAVEDIRNEVGEVWNVIREIAELETLRANADPAKLASAKEDRQMLLLEPPHSSVGGTRSSSSNAAAEPLLTQGWTELPPELHTELRGHDERLASLEEACDHLQLRVADLEDLWHDAHPNAQSTDTAVKVQSFDSALRPSLMQQAETLAKALQAARALSGPPEQSSAFHRDGVGGRSQHSDASRLETLHEDDD